MIDKNPSLIEDKVMISVTNIYFCDIEGIGKYVGKSRTKKNDRFIWVFLT